MTKPLFLFLALCFTLSNAMAQEGEEDYLDKIANKTCECIEKKSVEKKTLNTMELGTCLLISARDYKDQLKKDHGLDMNTLTSEEGERLGELIGLRMAFVCPSTLALMSDITDDEDDETNLRTMTSTGKITKVEEGSFIVFQLKNEQGKSEKFYWLTFVSSDYDLQNEYKNLKGKKVTVDYIEQELFDPRLNEYRKLNVLTDLYLD
jgi:hypothetical protein